MLGSVNMLDNCWDPVNRVAEQTLPTVHVSSLPTQLLTRLLASRPRMVRCAFESKSVQGRGGEQVILSYMFCFEWFWRRKHFSEF
jgi:hypothetical protein